LVLDQIDLTNYLIQSKIWNIRTALVFTPQLSMRHDDDD